MEPSLCVTDLREKGPVGERRLQNTGRPLPHFNRLQSTCQTSETARCGVRLQALHQARAKVSTPGLGSVNPASCTGPGFRQGLGKAWLGEGLGHAVAEAQGRGCRGWIYNN